MVLKLLRSKRGVRERYFPAFSAGKETSICIK